MIIIIMAILEPKQSVPKWRVSVHDIISKISVKQWGQIYKLPHPIPTPPLCFATGVKGFVNDLKNILMKVIDYE
jgi:hypothetical protein